MAVAACSPEIRPLMCNDATCGSCARDSDRMARHAVAKRVTSPAWTLEDDDEEHIEEGDSNNFITDATGKSLRNCFDFDLPDDGGVKLRNIFCKSGPNHERHEIPIHDDRDPYLTRTAADRPIFSDDNGDEDDDFNKDDNDGDNDALYFAEKGDEVEAAACLSPTRSPSSSNSSASFLRANQSGGSNAKDISIDCLKLPVGENVELGGEENDVVDLDELILRQQEAVSRRRRGSHQTIVPTSSHHRAPRHRKDYQRPIPGKSRVLTLEERWKHYVRTLPNTFFRSKEALMNRAESAIRGKPLFSGLRVEEQNNSDMRRVFHLCFESKIQLGQPRGTYDQFRCAVGQYLRTYLSFHTDRVLTACAPGRLFESMAEFRLVRAFIGQYQVRASATTVMGKAMHLRRLADEAVSYFTETNEQEQKGRCLSVASYLRSVAASYKTEARRTYRSRNTISDRAERGALLLPADFQRCFNKAKRSLQGIMQYVVQLRCKYPGDAPRVQSMLCERNGIMEKWNINLLAALILSGGGQRPQVYAQLELPQASELERFSEDCSRNKQYFALRAGREKTARSVDLPTVLFPRKILEFIQFHVLSLRPILVCELNSTDRLTAADSVSVSLGNTLFLHTKNGRALTSSDVKRTLSRFLERVDPEFSTITPMSIRGSYASMMLQARRRKEIFPDMNENAFLEFLAKQMNTSVEQLATTYASCDVDAFEEVANEMMVLCGAGDSEDDNREIGHEAEQIMLDPSPAEFLWN
jgi:hypothetical protein